MQVAHGQCKEFAKGAGVFHDPEYGPARAVAAQTALAPVARAAGEVDLTGDASANPGGIVGLGDFADEFVPGSAGEAVVAELEFEIGGADPGGEQADSGEALRSSREWPAANFHAACFKMDGEHRNLTSWRKLSWSASRQRVALNTR